MQLNQDQSCSEPNATENVTDNNNYFIDVTSLGLHNKDFTLVTQASILLFIIIL